MQVMSLPWEEMNGVVGGGSGTRGGGINQDQQQRHVMYKTTIDQYQDVSSFTSSGGGGGGGGYSSLSSRGSLGLLMERSTSAPPPSSSSFAMMMSPNHDSSNNNNNNNSDGRFVNNNNNTNHRGGGHSPAYDDDTTLVGSDLLNHMSSSCITNEYGHNSHNNNNNKNSSGVCSSGAFDTSDLAAILALEHASGRSTAPTTSASSSSTTSHSAVSYQYLHQSNGNLGSGGGGSSGVGVGANTMYGVSANNSSGGDGVGATIMRPSSAAADDRNSDQYFGGVNSLLSKGLVRSQSAAPSFSSIGPPPGLNLSPTSAQSSSMDSFGGGSGGGSSNTITPAIPFGATRRSASTGLIGAGSGSSNKHAALRPAAKTLMDLIQEDYPTNNDVKAAQAADAFEQHQQQHQQQQSPVFVPSSQASYSSAGSGGSGSAGPPPRAPTQQQRYQQHNMDQQQFAVDSNGMRSSSAMSFDERQSQYAHNQQHLSSVNQNQQYTVIRPASAGLVDQLRRQQVSGTTSNSSLQQELQHMQQQQQAQQLHHQHMQQGPDGSAIYSTAPVHVQQQHSPSPAQQLQQPAILQHQQPTIIDATTGQPIFYNSPPSSGGQPQQQHQQQRLGMPPQQQQHSGLPPGTQIIQHNGQTFLVNMSQPGATTTTQTPYGYATIQYHQGPPPPQPHQQRQVPQGHQVIQQSISGHHGGGPSEQQYVSIVPLQQGQNGAPSPHQQIAYWPPHSPSDGVGPANQHHPQLGHLNQHHPQMHHPQGHVTPGGSPPPMGATAATVAIMNASSNGGPVTVTRLTADGHHLAAGMGQPIDLSAYGGGGMVPAPHVVMGGGGSAGGARSREKGGGGGGRSRRGGGGNPRRGGGAADAKNSAQPSSSPLLDEFRAMKSRDWTMHNIVGHVVEFCQDQNGSRFIQQRLELGNIAEQQVVVNEVLPAIRRLRNDVFGNYVVQKLFDFGSNEVKAEIRATLEGEMLQLSLQMYGCRVVQKALEALDEQDLPRLLTEFHHNVLSCIHDQNGNHVIQKCIEVVSKRARKAKDAGDENMATFLNGQIDFIIRDVLVNTATLSCHPYGCRVLQRILEHCEDVRKTKVLDEIKLCHKKLLDDQYGNYVIQHVLQYGRPTDRDSILAIVVQAGLLGLSRQKFASNVVEKLLKYGNDQQRCAVVREMLKIAEDPSIPLNSIVDNGRTSVVLLMVRDAYANYVVQTTLDVIPDSEEKQLLLAELNAHADELRQYTFAKHIVAKLGSLTGTS